MNAQCSRIGPDEQPDLWRTPLSPGPILSLDEVHVWRASLAPPSQLIHELAQALSDDEQSKAERFRFERHRRRFIVARGTLRMILSHYAGAGPSQLHFAYGPHGKPYLPAPINDRDLQFNLAHAHELALYAFTYRRAVGIDLEFVQPIPGFDQSGLRLFSAREKQVFHALPEEQKLRAFFNCWTRKEAYIKARGDGLSMPLDKFEVSLAPGERAALLAVEADAAEPARWSLRDLAPGPGYAAALAVEGSGWRLGCWQYLPLDDARG